MRIPLLLLGCFLCISPTFAADLAPRSDPNRKLNILFIAVDDLRPELGCYGVPIIRTPHIDALGKRSLIFNRAYCQQAVCSPSRTSLLTGRRPDTTKVYDLKTHFRDTIPDVITLPQHFKDNGYHTQSFGKIYHGGLDDKASWSVPHTASRVPHYGSKEIVAELKRKGADVTEVGGKNKGPAWEAADVADNMLPDGHIAERAVEAMRNVKDKPFFLAVGFVKPHLPFVAPRRFFDLYPLENLPLTKTPRAPQGAPALATTDFGELRAYDGVPKAPMPVAEQQARELIRGYYAATTYMDEQVGKLMAALDALGLRDNTIVILWGDHGWHLGDHGMWTKHTNFEIATRVPLLLSAPGMKASDVTTNALAEFVDVYPTLCELAKLPLPRGLEGTSLAPLLEDPARAWKKAAFSQYPRARGVMGYSMRTDRHRYTEWQQRANGGKVEVIARELYDHQADPLETKNLAGDDGASDQVKGLSTQLRLGWEAAQP